MTRWFRSYADKHRNPKIARLSDSDFRLWDQLLCVASENDGRIPPAEDLKHLLNRRLDHLSSALKRLVDGRLIEALEVGYVPRNWNEKQYKSDTSTPRVQKFRAKGNVSGNVSGTSPDTETDTEVSEPNGSASLVDAEAVMWQHGKRFLTGNGVPAAQAGSMLGKWKRDYGAGLVIEALGKAQREGAIDPVSFITACLGKRRGNAYNPDRITV